MKKTISKTLHILLSVGLFTMLFSCNHNNKESNERYEEEAYMEEEGDEDIERYKQEFEMTKDPATGTVPADKFWQAIEYTKALKEGIAPYQTEAIFWEERGPIYDSVGPGGNRRGGGTNRTEGYTAGRINCVLVDATDATGNTVFCGGVTGGIWKCTNFLSTAPNWVPVNDFLSNMSISWICQDPTNGNTMYAATGEPFFNQGAVRGNGVFKSTDHGVTWTQLSSTAGITRSFKIECDAVGNVYYATGGSGLRRSINGGTSWTTITPTGTSSDCTDFEISSTGRLHASFGFFGSTIFYRYSNTPATVTTATWLSGSGIRTSSTSTSRLELAVQGDVVYGITCNSSRNVDSCYKSIDGGATWTLTNPTTTYTTGIANGQGWVNLTLAISPGNSNEIIMGGLDAYRSTNSGSTITKISYWASSSPYVHADHHYMKWWNLGGQPKILISGDGGIFYSTDNAVTFKDKNKNLALKQFYACAIHPTTTNYFLAGAQDNGSHQFKQAGLGYSTEVTGGDGCFTFIDQQSPNYQFTTYVYNAVRRSTDGGNSFSSFTLSGGGSFVNPMDYDSYNKKLFCNDSVGKIIRWDNPATTSTTPIVTPLTFTGTISGTPTAVTVSPFSSVGNGKTILFIGTNTGRLYKLTGADTVSSNASAIAKTTNISGASFPSGTLKCIAVGNNESTMLAVFSNYGVSNVWITTNSGSSWTAIDGNLPDMPVRWAAFHPTLNNRVLLATEAGVYYTLNVNGSSTQWLPSAGFPLVRTDMFKIRASDNTIAAATYGRGLWTGNILNILPLKDIALKLLSVKNNNAYLEWKGIDASTKIKYTLQASNDGVHFYEIEKSDNSKTNAVHGFNLPKMYYRVIGTEPNSAAIVSNTIVANATGRVDAIEVSITPNPVALEGKFLISSKEKGTAYWQIINSQGKLLQNGKIEIQQNTFAQQNFSTNKMPAGGYFLKINFKEAIISKSFIKQ